MENILGFDRPTFDELVTQVSADFESRLGVEVNPRRNTTGVYAFVIAGIAQMLQEHLDYASLQTNVLSADSAYLDQWGAVWAVTRKGATAASGTVTLSGQVDGTSIPAGTILLRQSDNAAFTTTTGVWISNGTATAAVTSSTAGTAGNAVAGGIYSLTSPLVGIDPDSVGSAMTGGTDAESDSAYRVRVLARISEPPQGGCKTDYTTWAKSYPGVTRAWVAVGEQGEATVTIRVLMDDTYVDGIPPVLDEVQTFVDDRRPVTARVFVVAPIAQPTNITIADLSPSNPTVKAAITAEIRAMLRRESAPGVTIPISKIWEAVSVATGEASHRITSPTTNITASSANNLITLGNITWA